MSEGTALALNEHIEAAKPRPYTLPWEKLDGKPLTVKLLFRWTDDQHLRARTYDELVWKPALAKAISRSVEPRVPTVRRARFHTLTTKRRPVRIRLGAGTPRSFRISPTNRLLVLPVADLLVVAGWAAFDCVPLQIVYRPVDIVPGVLHFQTRVQLDSGSCQAFTWVNAWEWLVDRQPKRLVRRIKAHGEVVQHVRIQRFHSGLMASLTAR